MLRGILIVVETVSTSNSETLHYGSFGTYLPMKG